MTPQELINCILQLAIQGKLVEQRQEEGTAEELYQQIQIEKQRFIEAGTIKEEKPLSEITEDEKPFDIPDSWKWVSLGDCTSYAQRKLKISADSITVDMWSLDLEDIEKETGRIVNYSRANERIIIGDKVQFRKGQILYSKLRPYLKKILVAPDDGICSSEMVPFAPYGNIDARYLVYVLKSPHVNYVINSVTYGVKMPRVGTETMVNLLIPLPPLAEQKRIIARIEELIPYIDRYEQSWSKLVEFNKRFPSDMQKSILQMAIQGKLVEQHPEEGTGEELYEQIQAEKQKLIKVGAIKKEKPLPEITEGEKPFEIPESWKWVRMSDVIDVRDGTHDTPAYVLKGYPLITGKDFYLGEFDFSKTQYISESDYLEISKRSLVEIGDILFSMIGGNIGSMIRITEDNYFKMAIKNVALFKQYSRNDIFSVYLFVFLKSQVSNIKAISKGGAQAFVSLKLLRNYLLPLPPLAEQKRICDKLNKLLPLCEKLK